MLPNEHTAMPVVEQMELLASILESSTRHSIIAMDLDGTIRVWNAGARRIYGYAASEVIGKSVFLLREPEDVASGLAQSSLDEARRSGVWTGEVRRMRKDGGRFTASVTITLRHDPAGKPTGFTLISHDLTESQRMVGELRASRLELERANAELEAFTYSVAHDLRAPLRAIDGFTNILIEDYGGTLDDEGKRLLNVVSSEARRMGRLIDDLLAFSRLGRQQMHARECDVAAMSQSVFDELGAPARARGRFELKPMPRAWADPAMLRQVLVNLIGNAVKFSSRQAAPAIEIGGSAAGGISTFQVTDNGAGFDQRYVHKLFGVFQRLHTKDEFEGTGVGLALVQRIIQAHGGAVSATGQVGAGATFTFTLPDHQGA